jgi:hypothetical protein
MFVRFRGRELVVLARGLHGGLVRSLNNAGLHKGSHGLNKNLFSINVFFVVIILVQFTRQAK